MFLFIVTLLHLNSPKIVTTLHKTTQHGIVLQPAHKTIVKTWSVPSTPGIQVDQNPLQSNVNLQ